MKSILKSTTLFLAFGLLASCSPWFPCAEDDNDYKSRKIQFENYYSTKYYSKDSLRYTVEQFSFYGDSSFSYLKILQQKNNTAQDTLSMLNGKFKVYKDSGLPWHVLKLNADSLYEKEIKDTLDGILLLTDFSSSRFEGLEDSLFHVSDVNRCFKLNTKFSTYYQRDDAAPCGHKSKEDGMYWSLEYRRGFCLKPPEQTPEQNSTTGDSL